MRIAIDARTFQVRNTGMGVVRILDNLLKEWISDGENEYFLYSKDDVVISDVLLRSDKIKIRIIRSDRIRSGFYWENFILPAAMRDDRISMLFSPAYTTSLVARIPKVILVHDISYKAIKSKYFTKQRFLLNLISRLSCYASKKIVTISEYSRSEIMKHYNVPADKIKVIYPGLEEKFIPADDCQQDMIVTRGKKSSRYILYVGTMFKRRHVEELVESYIKLSQSEINVDLVLVGENKIQPKVDLARIVEQFNAGSSSGRIIWKQYVSEEELLELYKGCLVFAYLSDYEGFGFPPLEAMACGAPVITGEATSLPEILGAASSYVDPSNIEEIFSALRKLIHDEGYRERMVKEGIARAKMYRWKESAAYYLSVFKEAVYGEK